MSWPDAEGRWLLRGEPEVLAAVRGTVMEHSLRGTRLAERAHLAGEHVYLKGGALGARPGWRHATRRVLLRAEPPRLAEFDNLAWLVRNGFGAPRPLFAAALLRGGRPRYQVLATVLVEDAVDLRTLLTAPPGPERPRALLQLALDLARLHARGFVHRDLFPRNLLWRAAAGELLFLDAWRGGTGLDLRGPLHDLACWMLFGADLLTPAEEASFFATYQAERRQAGVPLRGPWIASVRRRRRALVRRLARQRARGSGLPAPSPHWSPRGWGPTAG